MTLLPLSSLILLLFSPTFIHSLTVPDSSSHPHNRALPHNSTHTRALPDYSAAISRLSTALLSSQRASWEQGTAVLALTELNSARLSPFSAAFSFSPGAMQSADLPIVQFARDAVSRQAGDGRFSLVLGGPLDGSALDSCSVTEAVLTASFILPDKGQAAVYRAAADRQLNFLFSGSVRRDGNGIISQRVAGENLAYWSDSVFMMPPMLAFYGALSSDRYLMTMAYNQVKGYRNYLRKSDIAGVWGHIFDASAYRWVDSNNWSTGNGWAAYGMARVLASMSGSKIASEYVGQQYDLAGWIKEIIDKSWSLANPQSGLLSNYIDQNKGGSFPEIAGSALIAATTYRLAVLAPNFVSQSSLAAAEKARVTIMNSVDPLGMVYPVVDALNWGQTGSGSPESVAFVIMMHSAWRDYYAGTGRTWKL